MKDAIIGIGLGLLIAFFLMPYFSLGNLTNLYGIKEELQEIKKELEKLNEWLCERN